MKFNPISYMNLIVNKNYFLQTQSAVCKMDLLKFNSRFLKVWMG